MDVKIFAHNGRMLIKSPFSFADCDPLLLYVEKRPDGIVRLTDGGRIRTYLRDENTSSSKGDLEKRIQHILKHMGVGVQEKDGQIFMDVSQDQIRSAVFQLSETIARLMDALERGAL